MYGKMQESGIIKIFPFICISAIWGQHPAFLQRYSSLSWILLGLFGSHQRAVIAGDKKIEENNRMGKIRDLFMEKAMAPHSSTLAWKIPWMEEPGGLQSLGSLGVGDDWAASLSLFTFMYWRRKWQPTPVFLPGEFHGQRSLAAYSPCGQKELDMTYWLNHHHDILKFLM